MVVVRFKDNGPGVSEAAQKRIFEPFFTTKKDGAGLGLWISERISRTRAGAWSSNDPFPVKRYLPYGYQQANVRLVVNSIYGSIASLEQCAVQGTESEYEQDTDC